MLKSIKSKSCIILFMLGIIITTPLVDAAYLAYTSTNTTNNFNHSSSGQSSGINSDHNLNRDAQLNFELPKDMNFSGYENSGTFPNYNMHEDSVNWGTYLSPNTSMFTDLNNGSELIVNKEYQDRVDCLKLTSGAFLDSYITYDFNSSNNGTSEIDFLLPSSTQFRYQLCSNLTVIAEIYILSGSFRFYSIVDGLQVPPTPGFSVDTWISLDMRWNRLGLVYMESPFFTQTPLNFGNYSVNNIRFFLSSGGNDVYLNGMNLSLGIVNNGIFSESNPLIQYSYQNSIFGVDNSFNVFDNDSTDAADCDFLLKKSYSNFTYIFDFLTDSTQTFLLQFSNGNDANRLIILVKSNTIRIFNGSTELVLQAISSNTWYNVEISVFLVDVLNFTISIDGTPYGPFKATGSLYSVSTFEIRSNVAEFNYNLYFYRDTEFFESIEDTISYKKDFKIDTVSDYDFTDGWFPSRALTVNTSSHVNITYDSVESWNYDEFYFETVFKIEDNSVFRWTLYNETGISVLVIEYHEESNRLSLFAHGVNYYITVDEINTNYPIWMEFEMIQQYTIVNGTYYVISLELYSLFDLSGGFLSTTAPIPNNFTGKYMFGLEFMSFGYTTATIYAIDSDIILEYFPFSFVSGFKDTGYIPQSILDIYNIHTDCYPTFDWTKYKVSSSFNVDYSTGYVFDILDGSQTYKRREVKSRVLHTHVEDSLAIESYQLQNNQSFDENSFSFTTVFNLSLNYTVEVDMGATKIYFNATEGIQRDGFNVWFDGETPVSVSNPNYDLPVVYLTIHKTTNHNNGLYYSVVLGSQYVSQSINITSNATRPIVNFYNFDVDNSHYYSNGGMEIYGMKLTTYDEDFEQYRPIPPTTIAANLEFYGGIWFNPTGLLFTNVYSDSVIITFPNPILSYPLNRNYTIDYSYIAELAYVSTITVGNVAEYEQTFIESRQGSNASVYNTNSSEDELFQYYQFSNFYINYSYLMVYIHPGNITINMVVYHEALWLMYIVDTQLGLLELALGLIVPFILMLLFPYAFYNVFGRNGAVIGFLVGFIVFGIGALISIPAAIIMSLISVFLAIIVYKQYGGNMNYYG